jgi:tetratricopeptide (TPR) repeat protein
MATTEATELFIKGLEALDHGHFYLARTCFEQANEQERTAQHCSYLAIALAKATGGYPQAITLGREAVTLEPDNPIHYLHLGQIYLMADKRHEALEVFRQGVRLGGDEPIIRELEILGMRKPLIFKNLPRSHPFNKYLGLLLSRLGLR